LNNFSGKIGSSARFSTKNKMTNDPTDTAMNHRFDGFSNPFNPTNNDKIAMVKMSVPETSSFGASPIF